MEEKLKELRRALENHKYLRPPKSFAKCSENFRVSGLSPQSSKHPQREEQFNEFYPVTKSYDQRKPVYKFKENKFTKGATEGGIEHWKKLDLIVTSILSGGHMLLTDHRSSGLSILMKAIAESTVSLENFDHVHCDLHVRRSSEVFPKTFVG